MVRPLQCRRIGQLPRSTYFKPAGIPVCQLEEICLGLDEAEALRLADLDGRYHEQAGQIMGVSRATFGRILESAHRKVAEAILHGKALRIDGGEIAVAGVRTFECQQCCRRWTEPFGTGRPKSCPDCNSKQFYRVQEDGGDGRGGAGQSRGRGKKGTAGQAGHGACKRHNPGSTLRTGKTSQKG